MKFLRNYVFRLKTRIDEALSSFSSLARQIIVWVSTITVLFWLSVLIYGTFYFYYVPVVAKEKPVYFRFSVCENGVGVCSFPTANLSLVKDGQLEVFKRGQVYKLILDLELPESEANKNLGMFMVEMHLYNKKGETVQSAEKSASLQYKSDLLKVLDTFFFSPLYLFGYKSQKQDLHIEMFSDYKDHPYNQCIGTVLVINSLRLEIYTATFRLFAKFSGIRYILYYWPVTAAIIGVTWNFVLLLFILLLSWYAFLSSNKDSTECKTIAKIHLPKKRKLEGSPRKPRKAVLDTPATPETLGSPDNDSDSDQTTLQTPPDSSEADTSLRLRQPYMTS